MESLRSVQFSRAKNKGCNERIRSQRIRGSRQPLISTTVHSDSSPNKLDCDCLNTKTRINHAGLCLRNNRERAGRRRSESGRSPPLPLLVSGVFPFSSPSVSYQPDKRKWARRACGFQLSGLELLQK